MSQLLPNLYETCSEHMSRLYIDRFRNWVVLGQKSLDKRNKRANLIPSWSSSKLANKWSNTDSLSKIKDKACGHFRGHLYGLIFMKLINDICPNDISVKFKTGSLVVKIRLPGQIKEHVCELSWCQLYCTIFMELCQNVCPNNIWNQFKTWSCGVKN